MKQETFFFRLEVLSPLHIGCDEDYEPTNFVVDEQSSELINFNPLDFISRLNGDEKTEFCRICDQGTAASLLEIFKFMQRHADKVQGRKVQVGAGFLQHYTSTLQISGRDQRKVRNELNQFRIERTAFQPLTGISYIPGSAIKGALRTALLNLRKPNRKLPTRDLEKNIFDGGNFSTDPMRLVKVSDFIAEREPENRIVYAVNKKKKPSKFDFSAPYQILEIIKPGASFIGSVSIVSPDGERGEIPRNPVTMLELKDALRQFFLYEKEREIRELAVVGIAEGIIPAENEKLLLRVGRHSGAESLTIAGYRDIRIKLKGRDSTQKNHATTIWLTSDHKKPTSLASLQPFGWLSATPLSSAELITIKEDAEKQREVEKQELKIVAQQRQTAEKERLIREQAIVEEEKRVAAEQQVREDQEAAKKESWESLTTEEQDLMIVRGGDLAREFASVRINNLYQEIWSKLDSAASEQQKALAQAFKERWQKENKWSVGKKKKQFVKVQKVKEILGEV